MRLTKNKVEEIIVDVLGEEGLVLGKHLYEKENISEFDLAKKTKLDIKIVRKMLYFLYNHNLVGFSRKKDKEKGWYIYYWTLLPESLKFFYYKKRKELLVKLRQRLEEEEKELFFTCPHDCVRLNFDQAMDFEFHCPECGELISQDSSKNKIAALKKEIREIEEELEKERKRTQRAKTKARKKVVKTKKRIKKKIKKKLVKKILKDHKRLTKIIKSKKKRSKK